MMRCFRLLAMVAWIALFSACGEDAPPRAKTDTAAPSPTAVQVQAQGRVEDVIIGTGEVTGPYYLIGEALSAVINKKSSTYKVLCTVESTGGSLFNVHAVMAGDLHFGLVQGQRNHEAVHGLGNWKARGPQKELRSVFSLPLDSAPLTAPAASARDTGILATSQGGAAVDAEAARLTSMLTLVTSASVPERVVYNFTKAVFENLSKLQDLHPAFTGITPQRMLEGLTAPIHPGALKYYKEAGWMKG